VAIREGELKNETLDAKSLQQIRHSDAVLVVLRHFDNGSAADPVGDFQRIREEFEQRADEMRREINPDPDGIGAASFGRRLKTAVVGRDWGRASVCLAETAENPGAGGVLGAYG